MTGVKGKHEDTGEPFEFTAPVTVVATGGIGGSVERIKKEWFKPWGEPPKVILNGSHQNANGAMHDEVSKLGGNITRLDWQWNYAAGVHHPEPHPERPDHGLSLVPPKSALWVNYQGERFGPMPLVSAFDTRYLVEQICREEKKYSWQVMNQRIAVRELAISGSEFNHAVREKNLLAFLKMVKFGNKKLVDYMTSKCVDFVVANSVKELAEKMNALTGTQDVDPVLLQRSIKMYDDNVRRGEKHHNDEQLRRLAHLRQYRGDKARICKNQPIDDPKHRPLIAIREFILSRKTLGGIQTDLDCQVLSQPESGSQHTINGLYAVGEAAGFGGGGVHGHRALEGTFLGGCIYNGRKAAHHIAGKKIS